MSWSIGVSTMIRTVVALILGLLVVAAWAGVGQGAPAVANARTGSPPVWSSAPAPRPGSRPDGIAAPGAWIDTQSREASRTFYVDEYLASEGIDSGWNGNHDTCNPGTTSAAFRAAMTRQINYFRGMAGIPPIQGFREEYNAKAQAAALMMSVNSRLSHSPSADWTCFTEAGQEGAGSSNLFLGVYGLNAISGYIYDPGSSNDAVGHRRWILYPQTQYMGTGDIPDTENDPSANALWVFDLENMWGPRPSTRDGYVAWPPPGYVPYQVTFPRWSFSYPEADFGPATIEMTRNGQPLSVTKSPPQDGYGENTLVWEPQANFSQELEADSHFEVRLRNVLIDGQPFDFAYTVVLFDAHMPYFASLAATDARQGTAYHYAILAKDPNEATGEGLQIDAPTRPAWLVLTDLGQGRATLSGTPGNSAVGLHPVTLRLTDNEGKTNTQLFTITVANVNDPPAFRSSPIVNTGLETVYRYNVVADDPDLIWGDSLMVTATQLPAWLALTAGGNGWATLMGTPGVDELGLHTVSVRVIDREGASAIQTFTLRVSHQARLPLLIDTMP